MPRRPLLSALIAVLLCAAFGVGAQNGMTESGIRALVADGATHGKLSIPGLAQRDKTALERFYALRGFRPAWTPKSAELALAEIRDAPGRGLRAADYGGDTLAQRYTRHDPDRAIAASPDSPLQRAEDDVALTGAMLRYLSDLHRGREHARPRPDASGSIVAQFDAVALLDAALRDGRLAEALDQAQPAMPAYRRLLVALARYRTLSILPWPALQLPGGAAKADPDRLGPSADVFLQRLKELGDVAPGSSSLRLAVIAFQQRHGLAADGMIGKATLEALNVAPAVRVEQIEFSLERLRWLPAFARGTLVAINIPSFRLWAFADGPLDESAELGMPVIVGRAVRTPTPIFVGSMQYIEFNPYWNVPPSIARNEIAPKLARDPGYLDRQDMEFVGADGARPVTAVTPQMLDALRSGRVRIRQRPGPKNALDGIKFALPNTMNIYLHGTPARELFGRPRRDFSHGCIRIADPAALAAFILRDQQEWPAQRIAAAMESGQLQVARLATPVPVVIFYATAVAGQDGRVFFLEDIYSEDGKLRRKLSRAPDA